MSTLVPAPQGSARREKNQGTVSLELCQSSKCWSVITSEKVLGDPIKLLPAAKGFLGSNTMRMVTVLLATPHHHLRRSVVM